MTPDASTPIHARLRWWGLVAGIAVSLFDVWFLRAVGVRFDAGGRDVTWFIALWFGITFATLGWLLGTVIETRRREKAQAEVLVATRQRLAHVERLAALGELSAAIAHEVRNPLAVVRAAAQQIRETVPADAAEAQRAAGFVIEEVDRLSGVTSALLAAARPLPLEQRAVGVRGLVDRAFSLAERALDAAPVRLRREAPDGLPPVRVDPDLVCQVLLGLLVNAAQAAPPGGEICLAARSRDGAVELAVSDSGPGVPAELRERIFEPFFTTRPQGTGLGLAVARRIVEAHGGRIAVGEAPGGGAAFTVRLPVAA